MRDSAPKQRLQPFLSSLLLLLQQCTRHSQETRPTINYREENDLHIMQFTNIFCSMTLVGICLYRIILNKYIIHHCIRLTPSKRSNDLFARMYHLAIQLIDIIIVLPSSFFQQCISSPDLMKFTLNSP